MQLKLEFVILFFVYVKAEYSQLLLFFRMNDCRCKNRRFAVSGFYNR